MSKNLHHLIGQTFFKTMTGSVKVVLAIDWSDTRSSSPGLGGFTMYSSTCTESSKMSYECYVNIEII